MSLPGTEAADGAGATVRQYWNRVWNNGDLAAVDELFADEVTNHGRPEPQGGQAFAAIAGAWREAFPDLEVSVEQEVVQDDVVVHRVRLTGTHTGPFRQPMLEGVVEPTGRTMRVEQVHIHEVRGGRITGHRAVRDDLGMFQQLGVLPASVPAAGAS